MSHQNEKCNFNFDQNVRTVWIDELRMRYFLISLDIKENITEINVFLLLDFLLL